MKYGVLALLALGVSLHADVKDTTREQKTFQMQGGERRLIVDGVNDSITVIGYSGNTVEVTVDGTWRADDNNYLADAKREVRVDMTQNGNTVKLYVDGPFRERNRGRDHSERHYDVHFEFNVKVPMDAYLELRTVNGGSVKVQGSDADYDVHNVNGGIDLKDMTGSGMVNTVNGAINVNFRQNPRKDCSFKTVNGGIDVSFQPALSANLSMKTFNGQVYSDFDVVTLPLQQATVEQQGMKKIYSRDRQMRVRAGSGGPELKFDTLNGTIRLMDHQK